MSPPAQSAGKSALNTRFSGSGQRVDCLTRRETAPEETAAKQGTAKAGMQAEWVG
jgi:hypothetical protein